MKLIVVIILIFLFCGILIGQDPNKIVYYTGNAKGKDIAGEEILTVTKNSGTWTKVQITMANILTYSIQHNSQTINGFNFTYSVTPSSTNEGTDDYGNTYTEAEFNSPPNSISMTSNYNGETNVNIPHFSISDSYPIPSGTIPSSIDVLFLL